MDTGKCQCDLKTKLVGDGCQYCNPELAAWYSDMLEEVGLDMKVEEEVE